MDLGPIIGLSRARNLWPQHHDLDLVDESNELAIGSMLRASCDDLDQLAIAELRIHHELASKPLVFLRLPGIINNCTDLGLQVGEGRLLIVC